MSRLPTGRLSLLNSERSLFLWRRGHLRLGWRGAPALRAGRPKGVRDSSGGARVGRARRCRGRPRLGTTSWPRSVSTGRTHRLFDSREPQESKIRSAVLTFELRTHVFSKIHAGSAGRRLPAFPPQNQTWKIPWKDAAESADLLRRPSALKPIRLRPLDILITGCQAGSWYQAAVSSLGDDRPRRLNILMSDTTLSGHHSG